MQSLWGMQVWSLLLLPDPAASRSKVVYLETGSPAIILTASCQTENGQLGVTELGAGGWRAPLGKHRHQPSGKWSQERETSASTNLTLLPVFVTLRQSAQHTLRLYCRSLQHQEEITVTRRNKSCAPYTTWAQDLAAWCSTIFLPYVYFLFKKKKKRAFRFSVNLYFLNWQAWL